MNAFRLLIAFCLVLLSSCGGGGGVDTGGTGGAVPAVASGPITGFGSVIVGGVRFDDTSAEVEDLDGSRRTRDELRLGMTVEIESGAIDDSTGTAAARRIRFESEIAGLVGAVDVAGQGFTVLGQQVMVDATTVFDDRITGGLAGLATGQPVEVYAAFDAALQRYRATRVEPATVGSGLLRLRGPVAEVNPVMRTVRVGTATYRYDRATDVPSTLAAGTWVRLRLAFDPSPVSLWEVQRFSLALREWADADEVRIEGLVSARSGSGFVVGGRVVDGSGVSLPAELVVGARVEVRGTLRTGVLRATRVTVKTESEHSGREFQFEGSISAIDVAAATLTVRNVVISTARPALRIECGGSPLAVGRRVEVRAVLGSNRSTLEATRITCR